MSQRRQPTQRVRIEDALMKALSTQAGVCSTWFLRERMPRAAGVIHTLRQEGWDIVTERCPDPAHQHKTVQQQYRLRSNYKQERMF